MNSTASLVRRSVGGSGMMIRMRDPFRRVRIGLGALALVLVGGTVGYLSFGFDFLDAIYQTVITVTTVGFNSPHPLDTGSKIFTIVLIFVGVGTALYTFSTALEVLFGGQMRELVRSRKMEREISRMSGHVIVCGWGRVGREVAQFLTNAQRVVVVIDRDPERISTIQYATVIGDVTEDETLRKAGIEQAGTLIAALDTDADNLFVTVASRSFNPTIHVIARARSESSEAKLLRVGANRVVNPQRLGGDRMAAFVTQPHVVDFVDVVMHDGSLEFRLEELTVGRDSPLAGQTLRSSQVHDQTGCLVLAIRRPDGSFTPNPSPEVEMASGDVIIGVGTAAQLAVLATYSSKE